jgi:1-aminocyclopropane-1-carboxylate deaminase
LNADVNNLLTEEAKNFSNWNINADYHFGGYAKFNNMLLDFIADLEQRHQICYEPIYTGKMMYGIYELAAKGFFKKGERIIVLHTGGLQGLAGLKLKQ